MAYARANPGKPKPFVIAAVMTLERNPGVDELKQIMTPRFCKMPRFRSRVDTTHKAKFVEREFDAEYHFQVFGLGEKVSKDQLHAFVTHALVDPLLDSHPLWKLIHIPEMEDGSSKVVFLCDHTISDGVGLVAMLMLNIVDKNEDAPPPVAPPAKKAPVKHSLATRARVGAYGFFQGQTQVFWRPDRPNPLKVKGPPSMGAKRLASCTTKIDLAKVKQLAKAAGSSVTVNDVLMSVFTKTIFNYVQAQDGDKVDSKKRKIRAMFPINLRKPGQMLDENGDPTNVMAFGIFWVPMRTAGDSAKKLIGSVKQQMDEAKISPAHPINFKTTGKLLPVVPRKLFVDIVSNFVNIGTCTLSNVPGPQTPVHIANVLVTDMEFYFNSIIPVFFGIFSMNGQVSCTVTCDEKVGVDPQVLADLFLPSFESMYHEVCGE